MFEEKARAPACSCSARIIALLKAGSKIWPRMNADKRESEKDND
jgi:hypothetical protein